MFGKMLDVFYKLAKYFQEPEKTLPWCEVQQGIYKVLEVHDHGQYKYDYFKWLKLQSEDGKTFFVLAKPSIVDAIRNRKNTTYINNPDLMISKVKDGVFYVFKFY